MLKINGLIDKYGEIMFMPKVEEDEFKSGKITLYSFKIPVKIYNLFQFVSKEIFKNELNFTITTDNPKFIRVGSMKVGVDNSNLYEEIILNDYRYIINTELYSEILRNKEKYEIIEVKGDLDFLYLDVLKKYMKKFLKIDLNDPIRLGLELFTKRGTFEYVSIKTSFEDVLEISNEVSLYSKSYSMNYPYVMYNRILGGDDFITTGEVTNIYLTEWGEEFETYGQDKVKLLKLELNGENIDFENI